MSLKNVADTCAHLGGISPVTLQRLVRRGELKPVRIPSVRHEGEPSRRLLFDTADLDAAIARWKKDLPAVPNAQLSEASQKGWRSSPLRMRTKGAA